MQESRILKGTGNILQKDMMAISLLVLDEIYCV